MKKYEGYTIVMKGLSTVLQTFKKVRFCPGPAVHVVLCRGSKPNWFSGG